MESTFNDGGGALRGSASELNANAGTTARRGLDAGGQEVGSLMADVQELLGQLTHVADPEIARLRTKVEHGMATAKRTLAGRVDQVQRRAKDAMTAGDGYVRDRPWQAVGIAALAGIVVGVLVGRR